MVHLTGLFRCVTFTSGNLKKLNGKLSVENKFCKEVSYGFHNVCMTRTTDKVYLSNLNKQRDPEFYLGEYKHFKTFLFIIPN